MPTVSFSEGLNDCEPKSHSTIDLRIGFAFVENLIEHRFRDAFTIVMNPTLYGSVLTTFMRTNFYFAVWRIFDCVCNQILKDPLQQACISEIGRAHV